MHKLTTRALAAAGFAALLAFAAPVPADAADYAGGTLTIVIKNNKLDPTHYCDIQVTVRNVQANTHYWIGTTNGGETSYTDIFPASTSERGSLRTAYPWFWSLVASKTDMTYTLGTSIGGDSVWTPTKVSLRNSCTASSAPSR